MELARELVEASRSRAEGVYLVARPSGDRSGSSSCSRTRPTAQGPVETRPRAPARACDEVGRDGVAGIGAGTRGETVPHSAVTVEQRPPSFRVAPGRGSW